MQGCSSLLLLSLSSDRIPTQCSSSFRSIDVVCCSHDMTSQVLGCGGQREGTGGGQPPLRRHCTRVAALMQLHMASCYDVPCDMMVFAWHEATSPLEYYPRGACFELDSCAHVVSALDLSYLKSMLQVIGSSTVAH